MSKIGDRLFIGAGGRVVAIDTATGAELWRTRLKSRSVTTVAIVDGKLYGAAQGEVFRLDPASGTIIWRNGLKGLGFGVVAFPGTNDAVVAAALAQEQNERAANAAGA